MIGIRDARPADAAGLAKVHVETWKSTYQGIVPDETLQALSVPQRQVFWEKVLAQATAGSHCLVAVDADDGVVGFSSGGASRSTHLPYEGEVYAIYVLASYHKQRIGQQLLQASLDRLFHDGYHSMLVWVLANNPACGFYERHGGRPVSDKYEDFDGRRLLEKAYAWNDLASFATGLRLYHIAEQKHWQAAISEAYRHPSLTTEGFIHCAERSQLFGVVHRYFKSPESLILLEIDPQRLTAPLRYENSFPHLYGPLNRDAVLRTYPPHALFRSAFPVFP